MNLMKQNMSQASTLLKFSTFESIPVESESSKEVQPLNVLTSTGCEVEEVEETADGDNTSLIHAHMASLSLAFIPVKSAPMLSQGIPLAKQMPKVKEVRSLRKESKDLEKNATGLLSSTAMLTKSLVAPSPIRTPVTISTNRTLFPDLIRVPGKNNFRYRQCVYKNSFLLLIGEPCPTAHPSVWEAPASRPLCGSAMI